MKKITALTLAIIASAMLLASCEAKLFDPVVDTTSAETTGVASLTPDPERDDAGNLILTSTENRKVYDRGRDYIIFSFLGETVHSIHTVQQFDSKTEAEEYVRDFVIECNKKGEVPPVLSTNGVYVITKVGFSTEKGSDGHYHSMLKEKIVEIMSDSGAVLK